MQINFEDERPIFVQIADGIEDAILTGAFEESGQIPSITELSVSYKINPATALKGISILVDEGVYFLKSGASGCLSLPVQFQNCGTNAKNYFLIII